MWHEDWMKSRNFNNLQASISYQIEWLWLVLHDYFLPGRFTGLSNAKVVKLSFFFFFSKRNTFKMKPILPVIGFPYEKKEKRRLSYIYNGKSYNGKTTSLYGSDHEGEGAAVLFTWFCYQLKAKPCNKTAAPSWPDPYWNGTCSFFVVISTVYTRWYIQLISKKNYS